MKSSPLLALFALLLPLLTMATPTPQISTKTATSSCASKTSFGGVPKRAFTVRGGEVLIANSKEEMEAILIKANGALVVIDHWAT
jgi:hypothetical protein